MSDPRLKLAVFIDFDNIEIGVKSTLSTQFDIGVVLEALKERGDVVSKIAYGDWTRAGDYSRSLTQHATKLVQRNLTPGGDKNGADINLALDALEMAFTHTHINAYVIVGGDSDFITLVEKLKQYDKQVFVVGGRAFTSVVMQRNCHEFIAYENLLGSRRSADRRQVGPVAQAPIDQALPLVRRALKVLSDREVSPQLGLLKSTLLQLDSTFSERTYGVSSFRDFAQKLASAGHVRLREHGRNVLVELADGNGRLRADDAAAAPPAAEPAPEAEAPEPPAVEPRAADGIREVRRIFQSAPNPPRFPMYVRQARQFMRSVDPAFDERKFGFGSLQDLLRACQRDGLFRIERDRQGVIRLFPGNVMQAAADQEEAAARRESTESRTGAYTDRPDRQGWGAGEVVAVEGEPDVAASADEERQEQPSEPDVVEGDLLQELESAPVIDGESTPFEGDAPLEGEGEVQVEAVSEPVDAGSGEVETPVEYDRPAASEPQRERTSRRRSAGSTRRKTTETSRGESAGAGRARKQATPRPRTARTRTRKTGGGE